MLVVGCFAVANDGGVSSIKVSEIKMRSVKWVNSAQKETPIAAPNFKIYITGEGASKLQKILPSEISVITAMQPEIAKEYNETFKSLGIYNKSKRQGGVEVVSPKIMQISCSDGEIETVGETGKIRIKKAKETSCVITIHKAESDDTISDELGDVQPFEPKVCR